MEIEENHHDDSFDSTNHHETLERFNATMDQRNNTTTTSRIIQSDSIVQMEMSNGDDTMAMDEPPTFPKLSVAQSSSATNGGGGKSKIEYRRIRCPAHRYTPLREHWEQILTPLVEYLKLQVRTTNMEQHVYDIAPTNKNRKKKDETGIHKASSVVLGTSNPLGSHCRSGMKISRRFYIVRSLIFYIYSWVVDGF